MFTKVNYRMFLCHSAAIMPSMAIIFVCLASIIPTLSQSQPCLPDGITFTTQSQIDSFQINYPNCTEVEGHVAISGEDITNLDGLNVITSIGGYLFIGYNDVLSSLSGLDNVTSIGEYLEIKINDTLTDLSGLDGLITLGGYMSIFHNSELTSISGLVNLTSIGERDLYQWRSFNFRERCINQLIRTG